jgi:uncharacterized protein (TIGR04255 family)
MPFPETPRVTYKKNPLRKVICQLRFPSILKIDAEVPAAFQERIRKEFPVLSEKVEVQFEISQKMEGSIPPELLNQALKPTESRNYEFSSEDEQWVVNLTRTFVALTANKYYKWEEFRDKLVGPLNALLNIYSPTHFSRIGLRYIDVIKRSELNLGDTSWSELLQPYMLGLLGSSVVADRIQSYESLSEIRLSDEKSIVRIVTKLETDPSGEPCFIIDSDFHIMMKTNVGSALDILDYFNKRASRLIRWCITERLHQAMEPENI